MNKIILKKIFNKKQGINLLKYKRNDLFGKPTTRTKKARYMGTDVYEDLLLIPINDMLEYTRDYSINNPDGKYYYIHNNLEYVVSTIKSTMVSKNKSPCHPENFSESIVKPRAREYIKNTYRECVSQYVERLLLEPLILHMKERINQQLKADYSEYLILKSCDNIIPTLKHSKGDDMYLVNNNRIESLNIKTTRNIWGINNPKDAIRELYEKQGENRFEYSPRLYIYLSDKTDINRDEITRQLLQTYDIEFTYKKQNYKVSGCRLVII